MTDPAPKTNSVPPRPIAKASTRPVAKARKAANDAGSRILEGVDANPVAVLAGGIALGLFAGALLPKTRREKELLGSLGARLTEGATAAAKAAKTAGAAELTAAGLNRVNANDQVNKLIESVVRALISAGSAAKEAAVDPAIVAKPAKKSRKKA